MMHAGRKKTKIKCEECGVKRSMERADARFCSEKCRQKNHRQRTLTIPGMTDESTAAIDQYTEKKKAKPKRKKSA